jgi:transposase
MRSHGTLAKSDAIDARGLARYGDDRFDSLPRWTAAALDQAELVALVERRRDLVAMRACERNRLSAPRAAAIADELASHIDDLAQRIRNCEQRIADLIKRFRHLDLAAKALRDITGVGPTIAAILLAGLPELGTMTRQQAAALAGLAPHPRDSGALHRHRATSGGRRNLRQPLFLAALAAARTPGHLADAYNGLIQRGKPKRLALIAIARRIVVIANAKVRDTQLLT